MPKLFPELAAIHTVVFDFDGVFTDNRVWIDQDGRESVCCDRGDGFAFDMIRAFQNQGKLKVEFFILSKETNVVVSRRAEKLKLACHSGISDKLAYLRKYLANRFPSNPSPFAGLIYLGNDLNDLLVMQEAGYAVAPNDAHPKVKEVAHLVLDQKGGEGFVRAFVEALLGIDQLSKGEIYELISHC